LWEPMDDFDLWNILKKKINARKTASGLYANNGDVWIASLGKNIGFEQNGKGVNFSRPVLIISKFNSQMVWVVPLSTKQKKVDFYFNFTDPYKQPNSLILAQLRLISTKRLKRKIYKLPKNQLDDIRNRLKSYL